MSALREIINAYDIGNISETYQGDVEISDLKEELGTKGHVLVIRGDRAYEDRLKEAYEIQGNKIAYAEEIESEEWN